MTLNKSVYQIKKSELQDLIRVEISKMSDVGNSTILENLTFLVTNAFEKGMHLGFGGYPSDIGEIENQEYLVITSPGNGNFIIYKKLK